MSSGAYQALHYLRHGDGPGQNLEPQRPRRLSEATGKSIPEIGVTTFRPPYTPFSFGSIAGLSKNLFLPVRRTPIYQWHADKGATFEPVGQWRRAYTYTGVGEDRHGSINREILAVRHRVGLLDASTLGKIEIKGPDAAEFLDRMYTNMFSTLKVGRCRYGLMMNELGFLIDDGVTVRLGEDHFLMHTTSGGADRIAAWLEEWLQTEWTHYKVFVTPVTEQWAQFAIAGPRARNVLGKLGGDFDFDLTHEAFPSCRSRRASSAAIRVRVYRISFSGEQSYEVGDAVQYGAWAMECYSRGRRGIGIDPMAPKRCTCCAPKRAIIVVGDETDGTTTPSMSDSRPGVEEEGGLPRQAFARAKLSQGAAGRKQLVGLLTEDPRKCCPTAPRGEKVKAQAADGNDRPGYLDLSPPDA